MRAKKPRSWTNEYVRHGRQTLLAALEIATGKHFVPWIEKVIHQTQQPVWGGDTHVEDQLLSLFDLGFTGGSANIGKSRAVG